MVNQSKPKYKDNVSPYLLKPLRTLEEVQADLAKTLEFIRKYNRIGKEFNDYENRSI